MWLDAVSAGMQAALARQRLSAVNIANARSSGYRTYRVVPGRGAPAGGPEVRSEGTGAATDLVAETVNQISTRQEMALFAAVLGRRDQAVGTLLDLRA